MALLETALNYIVSIVTENEEAKKFPKDFVTASLHWIRSWFLKDDPVTSSIVDNPALPEAVKKPVIEAKLNVLKDNPDFMRELAERLESFNAQRERLKNVINDANIEVEGNFRLGDNGQSTGDDYDQKNVIKGGTIKTGGDFRMGDDVFSGNEKVQVVHNYYGAGAKPGQSGPGSVPTIKTELQQLIREEKIGAALDRFLDVLETQDLGIEKDELLLLSARYNRISGNERKGLTSAAEAGIERNKINGALVELIGKIK